MRKSGPIREMTANGQNSYCAFGRMAQRDFGTPWSGPTGMQNAGECKPESCMAPVEREKCRPPRVTCGDVEAAEKKKKTQGEGGSPRQVTQGEGGSPRQVKTRGLA